MLTKTEIEAMDSEECIELAEELYERAYSLRAAHPLTEEQKKMLDERLEYSLAHPGLARPWKEVMDELEAKYKDV